jgi:hypothetical protein
MNRTAILVEAVWLPAFPPDRWVIVSPVHIEIAVASCVDRGDHGALLLEIERKPTSTGAYVQDAEAFHRLGKTIVGHIGLDIVVVPDRNSVVEGEAVIPPRQFGNALLSLVVVQFG